MRGSGGSRREVKRALDERGFNQTGGGRRFGGGSEMRGDSRKGDIDVDGRLFARSGGSFGGLDVGVLLGDGRRRFTREVR